MIGIAVVGAGRIGQIHAGNLHRNDKVSIRHIVDVADAAAKSLAQSCGAKASRIEAALDDDAVDAVVIATSTDTHAALIGATAAAGKAIFCEKPLDLDIAQATQSLQVAADNKVLLCLGFNRRHDPSFNRLKTEIDTGTVGDVETVSITSRDPAPPPAEYIARSGGLFRDMMIHDFDMARWLLGEEPVRIYATGSAMLDEIANAGDIDTAAVVLTTASGRFCQITNSRRCSYGYDQRIEVFGSAGMVCAGNKTETQVTTVNADGFHSEPALPFFLERYADAYRIQLEKFVIAVEGGDAKLPLGQDGLRALQIADAAQRSSESGLTVEIAPAG